MTSNKILRLFRQTIVAGVVTIALSTGVNAAEQAEESKATDASVQTGLDLSLANQLAAYGDRNDDAMSLIVAASIKKGVGTTVAEGEKETEGTGEATEKEERGGNSADDMLARASTLAGDNEELAGLIADVEAMASRGDVQGAGCYNDSVLSGYTDTWNIRFTPGSNYVDLSGDGDTDLDLYVYGPDGHLVCSSESYYDDEFCSWHQYRTANVRVKIKNLGNVYNVYDLCTN